MIIHKGRGLVNKFINNLPFELHLPGYQYCGPGTKLQQRLRRGDPGINPLDAACKEHDIAYSKNRENVEARNVADKILAERAWQRVLAKDANLSEKAAAYTVTNIMKAKSKLGMGIGKRKKNKKKAMLTLKKLIKSMSKTIKPSNDSRIAIQSALRTARNSIKKIGGKKYINISRILPVPKVGGFLPALIPIFAGLSAVGSLAGGAAGIAQAINKTNNAKQKLEEMKRHNEKIEALTLGKGLYLKPYKKGYGICLKKNKVTKKKKFVKREKKNIIKVILPKRALTNLDLRKYAHHLKIFNFRGVFMRNTLPPNGPLYNESAIINLDDSRGPGTHWVAYKKNGKNVIYFDSFGDLQPPMDLMQYWNVEKIKYNYQRYQIFNSFICGHLCLKFLCNLLDHSDNYNLYKKIPR